MANNQTASSPRWSTTTKIVVTLLILTAVIALLIRFAGLLSTLITAFIIAVLFHPIAEFINRKTKIPWTWSVSIIYLITVVLVFGLLTVGGIALINQINELIKFLQTTLLRLPGFIDQLTTTTLFIGPFELDFSYINWDQIGTQLLNTVQPVLTRMGNLFGSVASGAVGFVGSFLLSLLISYLIITETEEASERMIKIEIPGYQEDIEKLGCLESISPRASAYLFIQVHSLFNHPNGFPSAICGGHGTLGYPGQLYPLYWRGDRLDHQFLCGIFPRNHSVRNGSIPLCPNRHGGRLDF